MSISSMSEAKLIRQRLDQRDANVVERALGLKELVERDQPTPEDMVKLPARPTACWRASCAGYRPRWSRST